MTNRLLGRRPRRRSPWAVILLVLSVLSCLTAFQMLLCGTPAGWLRFREAASLPRPRPAELEALPAGTRVLIAARLPRDAPVEPGSRGLALFYVERHLERDTGGEDTPPSSLWEMEQPPPQRVEMALKDGTPLLVQIPQTASFLNAQQIEIEVLGETGDEGGSRRYTGYLPGQNLTVEGIWEGQGLVTASALYAGAPDGYPAYLARQTGTAFLMGVVCGGLGLVLLLVAGVLRLLGK